MHNYHKLEIYKKAIKAVSFIYEFTKNLPEQEKFGLINQIRRAAISITNLKLNLIDF